MWAKLNIKIDRSFPKGFNPFFNVLAEGEIFNFGANSAVFEIIEIFVIEGLLGADSFWGIDSQ